MCYKVWSSKLSTERFQIPRASHNQCHWNILWDSHDSSKLYNPFWAICVTTVRLNWADLTTVPLYRDCPGKSPTSWSFSSCWINTLYITNIIHTYNLNTWEVEVGVQQFKVILNLYIKSEARATWNKQTNKHCYWKYVLYLHPKHDMTHIWCLLPHSSMSTFLLFQEHRRARTAYLVIYHHYFSSPVLSSSLSRQRVHCFSTWGSWPLWGSPKTIGKHRYLCMFQNPTKVLLLNRNTGTVAL